MMLKQLLLEAGNMECHAGGFAASAAINSLAKTWENQDVDITEIFSDFDMMLAELISLRLRIHKTEKDGNEIAALDVPTMKDSQVRPVLDIIRAISVATETAGSCKRCVSPLRADGYCLSGSCPLSDWPQSADFNRLMEVTVEQYQKESGLRKRIHVDADAHSDDRFVVTTFDAGPYFQTELERFSGWKLLRRNM